MANWLFRKYEKNKNKKLWALKLNQLDLYVESCTLWKLMYIVVPFLHMWLDLGVRLLLSKLLSYVKIGCYVNDVMKWDWTCML